MFQLADQEADLLNHLPTVVSALLSIWYHPFVFGELFCKIFAVLRGSIVKL